MPETPTTANRFAGPCARCGAKVAAEAGVYSRDEGCTHATEAECKTTTKTWRKFDQSRRHSQAQADSQAAWAAAGFPRAAAFYPMNATTDSSTHRHGTIDGTAVTVVTGGMPHWERGSWVRVRVDGHEVGRFTLDDAAIKAAATDADPYRRSVQRTQAEIDQIVAGVKEALR